MSSWLKSYHLKLFDQYDEFECSPDKKDFVMLPDLFGEKIVSTEK